MVSQIHSPQCPWQARVYVFFTWRLATNLHTKARCDKHNKWLISPWGLENSPEKLEKRWKEASRELVSVFHAKWPSMMPFDVNVIGCDLWIAALLWNTINHLRVATQAKGHLPITQLSEPCSLMRDEGMAMEVSSWAGKKRLGRAPCLSRRNYDCAFGFYLCGRLGEPGQHVTLCLG